MEKDEVMSAVLMIAKSIIVVKLVEALILLL